MSLQELEADIVKRLREYIREPQVFVTVVQFRSEPVFFVGLFVRPGIYTLQGNRTLLEMLTSVGGLQPNAERHVKITRHEEYGPIPLPDARVDPEKKVSTVEVNWEVCARISTRRRTSCCSLTMSFRWAAPNRCISMERSAASVVSSWASANPFRSCKP